MFRSDILNLIKMLVRQENLEILGFKLSRIIDVVYTWPVVFTLNILTHIALGKGVYMSHCQTCSDSLSIHL